MKIEQNSRVLLVGKTGSGKTYLAVQMLKKINRLVIFDTKGNLSGKFAAKPWNVKNVRKFARGANMRLIIGPAIGTPNEQMAIYDGIFKELYDIGNLTIYIDEIYGIVPPNKTIPPWLSAVYTRGRELKIGVWASSQRPSWIPMFLMSESEWFFIFKLQLDDDRKRMAGIVGKGVLFPVQDEHGFFVYNTLWDEPKYMKEFKSLDKSSETV
jgi:energy-coupling factor transporter ATP-binding protein EcfA2